MDAENDLEEQLTSYHICKLPTESLPEEPQYKIIKTEDAEIPLVAVPIPPPKRKQPKPKVADEDWYPPVAAKKQVRIQPDDFRLEVFTVESARGAEKVPAEPPEEILSTINFTKPQTVVQMSTQPTIRASTSNGRAEAASTSWYQMPANEVVPKTQSLPPLSQIHNTRSTTKKPVAPTPSSVVKMNPLHSQQHIVPKSTAPLMTLPIQIHPSVVKSNLVFGQQTIVKNPQIPPVATQYRILTQNPIQANASRIVRKRPNEESPPMVIKVEDDDEDISVNTPPPPPIPQVESTGPRHVIKLVTSVPVSKYPCEFCGISFEFWTQRDNHLASHKIHSEYICFVCQKAAQEYYITEESIYTTPHYHFLQAHLAESHKITGQPRGFQCPYCSIHPANYEALVRHLSQDHDTSELTSTYIMVNVLEDRLEG